MKQRKKYGHHYSTGRVNSCPSVVKFSLRCYFFLRFSLSFYLFRVRMRFDLLSLVNLSPCSSDWLWPNTQTVAKPFPRGLRLSRDEIFSLRTVCVCVSFALAFAFCPVFGWISETNSVNPNKIHRLQINETRWVRNDPKSKTEQKKLSRCNEVENEKRKRMQRGGAVKKISGHIVGGGKLVSHFWCRACFKFSAETGQI